jgi:hypothetical protein
LAKTINGASGSSTASTANTTQYWFPLGSMETGTTESQKQIILRSTGTISNIRVAITANSIASGTTTFKLRKNAASGNGSVTITASTTGVYEDTTNTDTIAAGDKICFMTTPGAATGTITLSNVGYTFDATNASDACSKLAVSKALSVSTSAVTRYYTLSGECVDKATESEAQCRQRKAGTFKNLTVQVTTNTRTTATTYSTRKGGVTQNLTLSVGSSTTGFFEDTTHSDTVAAGEDWNYIQVYGTGATAFVTQHIAVDFFSTASIGQCLAGRTTGITYNANDALFDALCGRNTGGGTESFTQSKARAAYTFSELSIAVTTNTITASTAFRLRVNGANGNQLATVTSSGTGVFSDSTNTDTVAIGDNVNYGIVCGATGTSMAVRQMSVWTLVSSVTIPQTVYVEWEEA